MSGPVNMIGSAPAPAHVRAADWVAQGDRARNALGMAVRNVGHLYGDALGFILERAVEGVTEPYAEAAYLFRQAIEERDARLSQQRAEIAEFVAILTVAVEETRQRFARARKPMPEWVDKVRYGLLRGEF